MKLPTLLLTTLLLASCVTSEPTPPAGRPIPSAVSPRAAVVLIAYGQLSSFTGDKIFRYPHFDLTFLGTRLDQSSALPAHLLNFQARNRSGNALAQIIWHPSSRQPGSFTLDGRSYRFSIDVDTLQIAIFPGN